MKECQFSNNKRGCEIFSMVIVTPSTSLCRGAAGRACSDSGTHGPATVSVFLLWTPCETQNANVCCYYIVKPFFVYSPKLPVSNIIPQVPQWLKISSEVTRSIALSLN